MRTLWLVGLLLAIACLPPLHAEEEGPVEPAVEPAAEPPAESGAPLPLPRALRAGRLGRSTAGAVEEHSGWTAAHVCVDGHWSAADYDLWFSGLPIDREQRLPGRGEARHDVTVTAMTLCAYLGAGWTHRGRHRYAGVIGRGLKWFKAQQHASGRIGPSDDLRAHAWATLALTEAYGMTGSGLWYASAKRALTHLIALQEANGAWPRSETNREDDLLGTFLASLALRSLELIEQDVARRGLQPVFGFDPGALRLTRERLQVWLDAHTDAKTGLVTVPASSAARPEEHPLLLTAAGLLTRIHLGADPRKDGVVRAAAKRLAKHPSTWDADSPTSDLAYVWFGTLALFQVGGQDWKIWNERLKTTVVDNRRRDGGFSELRGSWDPHGPYVRSLGRVGSTALATLCLEVYYRYDKVFGDAGGGGVAAPAQSGSWHRSALPPHAAIFEDRDGSVLPIESARLAAEIHGVRARVVLDLWVRNPGQRQQEGRLRLRLPDGAAPYYLAFGQSTWERAAPFLPATAVATDRPALQTRQSGEWGSVREARMAPTASARTAYRTIVSSRRDPALLTWAGGGVFDLGVFPLMPGKLHRVVLGYEVDLVPVGEEYELSLHLPEDVRDVAAALSVRGAAVRTVPEAPVAQGVRRWVDPAEREIRVFVRPPETLLLAGPDAAGRDHVALWVRPDIPASMRVGSPERGIFLLDTSKSGRDGHFDVRLQLLESILEENRDELKEFALAAFDSEVRWWRDGFVENSPANVEALLAFARGVELAGATDLGRALAVAAAVEGQADIFLLSDGNPTWGVADGTLQGASASGRVFAYRSGMEGESVPRLHRIVSGTGGALIPVLGPGDVPAASTAHRHGVWGLKGLELAGVTDLFAVSGPNSVHRGQRLRLVGRGRPEPGAELQIHLERGADSRTLRVPLPPAVSSSMAARAYGHAAVVELEALGADARSQALAYASHFRVVREAAALVMLETEKDYETHGLEQVDYAPRVAAEPVGPVVRELDGRQGSSRLRFGQGLPGVLRELGEANRVRAMERTKASRRRFVEPELPPRLLVALEALPPEQLVLFGDLARNEGTRPLSRAAGSRLEARPDSLDALLGAAFDAWDAGHRWHAYVGLCAGVVQHPHSRLLQWQLARMAGDLDLVDQAIAWFELALAWPGRSDLVDIVAHDYARFLRHVLAGSRSTGLGDFARARAESLAPLALLEEADLVILLAGSARSPDVELGIVGREGQRRYRTYDRGDGNSFYVGTTQRGHGPKMFVAPEAAPGDYAVEVVLPPARQGMEGPPVRVQVVVVHDWGRATEHAELRTVLVSSGAPQFRLDPWPR